MLLFTGKGGVGKTSVAAATAVRVAGAGGRVLLTSTDPAHSLSDVLHVTLDDEPRSVTLPGDASGSLDAQQLDAQARLEARWDRVRDYLAAVLAWGGVGDVAAEELVTFPGLDELFALLDLREHVMAGDHDAVIVDCAPTAETLKLLALPDALRWYADRVLGPGRRIARAVAPLTRPLGVSGAPFPVPDDEVFDTVGEIHTQLSEVHALLTDTGRSSVRLVATPERLALAESSRMLTTLSLFGYGVDAVVVNRLLPDVVNDPYLARWKQRHTELLAEARATVAPVPVLTADLLDDEPIGAAALDHLGARLYVAHDPAAVLHDDAPVSLEVDDEIHRLRVRVPGADRDDVDLHRQGDDLLVKVAGVRRTIPLPATLRRRQVVGACVDDGVLTVRFAAIASTATGS